MFLNHHAYLLVGDRLTLGEKVKTLIKEQGTAADESYWFERKVWGIEDSRQLGERQSRKSWDGQRKFFVVTADVITLPAQQALLKILEEPSPGTLFFLICRERRELLPTLISRCQIIRQMSTADKMASDVKEWVKCFTAAAPLIRLELARELTNEEVESRRVIDLAVALETAYHARLRESPTRELAAALVSIRRARDYLAEHSNLPGLIFEHLALTLPVLPVL